MKLISQHLPPLNEHGEDSECLKKNPNASVTEIAKETGISRPTVYKYLKDF
jgi:predicted DNA-binding transcriptional regulator AlpA